MMGIRAAKIGFETSIIKNSTFDEQIVHDVSCREASAARLRTKIRESAKGSVLTE